jgi:hypothetical protein
VTLHLLDTNILSELARRRPNANVVAFVADTPRLAVSVILFHELQFGCETVADPARKAALSRFRDSILTRYADSAFPVDRAVALRSASLRALSKRHGRALSLADSIMAATAVLNSAILVTRNEKHFAHLDVAILNPFE